MWLEHWRAEIWSHVPLEPIQPENREDDCESGPENGSISRRKGIILEPKIFNETIRVAWHVERL